ncbi:MAG: hypothetical protein DI569_12500 [Sphingopyxis macrogoltabida]|uniref:Bacteriophage tail tape measure N-terminal domain-containing protein n=1 Tax=Sphingopyxis macrogoltabida TaxID=33050 RepID=A0A2W5KW53_SPHMC|nr:MAG: hypothetical protein DI569_12500 [Sphingopyxis macrogoltabida]
MGVGFAIDPEGSFETLRQIEAAMNTTEARVVAEAAKIERATSGMISLGGATAQMTAFGNAATRELASASREMARAEKAGETLSRQLDRQTSTFGKTREELRAMKVETAALAAEQQGLTELATRLRAQEAALYDQEFAAMRKVRMEAEALAEDKALAAQQAAAAAEREATATREAAWAYQMFEAKARAGAQALRELEAAQKLADRDASAAQMRADAEAAARLASEHARLAAQVRASHAAQEADAVAAERLRMSTDPLYAAMQRLNAEIAESTRLYHAGVTAPAEYARQQDVLAGRLRQVTQAHDEVAQAAKRGASTMTQFSFQVNDIVTMAMSGAPVFQIFATQIGQIVQVAQMAEGGVKGFAMEVGGLALRFLPFAAAAAVAGVALSRWHDQLNKEAGMKAYANSLGLTAKEMEKLKNVSVTAGDVMSGVWKTLDDRLNISSNSKKLIDWLFSPNDAQTVGNFVAEIYGAFVGGYKGIVAIWSLLPSAIGDLVAQATNATIAKVEQMVNGAIEGINGLAQRANQMLGVDLFGQIGNVSIERVTNLYEGAAAKVVDTFGTAVQDETKRAKAWMAGVVGDIEKNSIGAAQKRLQKQRDDIVKDRTPASNKHAEQLAREAAAVEAQIRNLYALADAYQVSGAAALVAEARVKAESQAIKQRGDIEAAVERQIRLAIAQRVSDAAKGTLATREQVVAQQRVNDMVSAGLVPAERASDLVRDQIADLPLLAALQVSQQRGYAKEIEAAKRALDDQRKAREQLTTAERTASFNAAMEAGSARLAELHEEIRLTGALDIQRVRTLATVRATREAEKFNEADRAAYIAQQVQIADLDLQRQLQADAFNDSLRYQADLLDAIATNVSIAASGMADAFGEAGKALGGLASTFASYLADQERMRSAREAELRVISQIEDAQLRAQREQQVNSLYAQRTITSQVGLYGDLTASAKGFFKEGSDGYKALETAEKAFRAVEFALSVRAIAQDAIETASSIAKSGARTATKAVEAVVSAISSLPFPLNLAAGAATIAALAGIGVSVAGSFGGNRNTLEKANDGTGTVLGDASAKSESIKRAIDSLKEVDTVMLTYSRQMAASLSAIESNISGFAALVLRTDNVNASAGVNTGFSQDTTGKVLEGIITGGGLFSKIPVVGGIIGGIGSIIGSLFGSKTKVVGSGLYGGAQSLEDILSGGFDASYYSDIQKKKKLFGLTTSTKYSTQYSDADSGLENQFTLILREFNNAILAAAGPLGVATSEIQQKLNGFVVNIGKIDLQGLTGEEIEEKLTAVFGAAADDMAKAAFPGIEKFQAVGEGLFDTLVRVASTVESVTSSLTMLGSSASLMSIDLKMALADQFDSVSDFSSAVDSYFETYYTKEEQAAARTAQFATAFDSLGLAMPGTLAAFRQLVDAQDLTTAAGQATYATLLQLAPAFADLQSALNGAKSAADILSERQDLEKQLLELQGNTAAIREMELAQLDESNRALQQQIWALQDAQEAADAAQKLKDAWSSVGDSIMDEVNRIRGITDGSGTGSFATLQGQFNAAVAAAKGGDQDAAGTLPSLSQALIQAAELAATSRQELDRVKAQTAASLESVYASVLALAGGTSSTGVAAGTGAPTGTILEAAATAAQASATSSDSDSVIAELKALREEVAQMRSDNNSGHAATAGNTAAIKKKLDDVSADSGGQAITVTGAAA